MADPYPARSESPHLAGAPGPLLDRFLARLIDGLIIGIPLAIVLGIVLNGILGLGQVGSFLSSLIISAAAIGYYAVLESSNGRTIGKSIMKLQVAGPDGRPPSMDQALRRNAWLALGMLSGVPFLGILTGLAELGLVIAIAVTIGGDKIARRGIHDTFAGTRVVKV
ncbi:MAG: RDD family protein [Nocardioides sp.]|nr:RDD family protein [Nocardioides sp.]